MRRALGILIAACLTAFATGAAPAAPVAADSQTTAILQFKQEHMLTVLKVSGAVAFSAEPKYESEQLVRGAVEIGSEKMGFVLDKGAASAKLYIDANRNGNLTDDQVYTANTGSSDFYVFPRIRTSVPSNGIEIPYELEFHQYRSQKPYLTVRSAFAGNVELGGRKWTLSVSENMDGKFGNGDSFRLENASGQMPSMSLGAHPKIFVSDRLYDLKLSFISFGVTKDCGILADFRPVQAATGRLHLDGKAISRLALSQGSDTRAIYAEPQTDVPIPAGQWSLREVALKSTPLNLPGRAASGPRTYTMSNPNSVSVSIKPNETQTLSIGGPLKNTVEVVRRGSDMTFNYKLVDGAGHEYVSNSREATNKAKLEISQGGKKVHTADFEYG